MARFRKRPVIVEATQWFPGTKVPGVTDLGDHGHIDTIEGRVVCRPGDWIITGIKGEKYPCRADIFEETYEAVP